MPSKNGDQMTLQDRIHAGLSADIANGVLRPGEKLRVAHLAKHFGTSQAPVREALRRLTDEGCAITEPYVGTIVKAPSWQEIQDLYALRAELESYAVRRYFAVGKADSMSSIRRVLRALARAVRTGNQVDVLDADLDFHRSVVSLAKSDVTLEMWEALIRRFRGARLSLMREHPDDLDTVVPTHEVLLEHLSGTDADRAQRAFREHLADAIVTWGQRTNNPLSKGFRV